MRRAIFTILILLFLAWSSLMLIPKDSGAGSSSSSTCALQRVSPNSGYAIVGPYSTVATGAANYGGAAGNTSKEFLTRLHHYRIRQNGTITRIKVYIDNKTDLNAFYFKVWRKNSSGTYDLVGQSENIVSSLTAGQTNTINIANTIQAQEGDYYGYRMEWGSNGNLNLVARTGIENEATYFPPNNNHKTYYVTNASPSATGYAWESQSSDLGYAVPIEMYMTPPVLTFIGSSLTCSSPVHYNYILNYTPSLGAVAPDAVNKSWPFLVAQKWNYTYQNMGYGGNTSTQMAARFATDIVALNPKYVIIEAGTNDQPNSISMTTFLSNMKSMLDAAQTANIKVVAITIPPRTSYTVAQNREKEIWNKHLVNLVSQYSNASVLELETYLGQFKSGGDTGNLWNIISAYDYGDNIHYGVVGLRKWADAVVDECYRYKRTL